MIASKQNFTPELFGFRNINTNGQAIFTLTANILALFHQEQIGEIFVIWLNLWIVSTMKFV